jgi:hypothetical protein
MPASLDSVVVRRIMLVGGAFVLPVAVLAAYLLISRQDLEFSVAGDYLALFTAVAVGTVCLWRLVGPVKWRPIAVVLYPLICSAALLMFSLSFLCAVFQECL